MCNKSLIKKYGPEWAILEEIAKNNNDSVDKILDILIDQQDAINWGELMEQAMSHKMFPTLAYYFTNEKLYKFIPPFINQYFTLGYQINRNKTNEIKKEALRITQTMAHHGTSVVCTKGIILEDQLYGGNGARFLSDVDFMSVSDNKSEINNTMLNLGYHIGTVDWRKNDIKTMSRVQYLMYISESSKLPEYVIRVKNELVNYVSAGYVLSFTWNNCPYDISVESALKHSTLHTVKIDNKEYQLPSLDNSYHFLYIILHLYKHAMVSHLSKNRNDVNLVKFMDVYNFWKKYSKELKKTLPQIISENHVEAPISWTLYHTDYLFGSTMLKDLKLSVPSDKYLYSTLDEKGNKIFWKGDMRDRLFAKDRLKLLVSNYKDR